MLSLEASVSACLTSASSYHSSSPDRLCAVVTRAPTRADICASGHSRCTPAARPFCTSWGAGLAATLDGALDRRITVDAALSVVQLRAGTGRAAVPSCAAARLDVRLPANVDVRAAVGKLARVARATVPAGVVVHIAADSISLGYAEMPHRAALMAVDDASRAGHYRSYDPAAHCLLRNCWGRRSTSCLCCSA
jgi:hypothetical protein